MGDFRRAIEAIFTYEVPLNEIPMMNTNIEIVEETPQPDLNQGKKYTFQEEMRNPIIKFNF